MISEENGQKLKKIAANFLFFTIILLPIVFVPMQTVPLFFTKSLVLSLGVSFSFLLLLVFLFKTKGCLIIPKNPIFIMPIMILSVVLLSALVSPHFGLSFSGYGFEIGTFISLYLFWAVFFLSFFLFKESRSVLRLILSLITVFILLSLFHILRLVPGLNFLDFGTFGQITSSPFGNWNELGFFAGLMILFSLILLESFFRNSREGKKIVRKILLLCLILGLAVCLLVNVSLIWLLTAGFVFVFVLLQLSHRSRSARSINLATSVDGVRGTESSVRNCFSSATLFFLFLMIFIFFVGSFFGQKMQSDLGINYLDVKPSWQSTSQVMLSTYRVGLKNFFLGSGPNSFLFEWKQWRPQEVNMTIFWNSEFHSGAGMIPTFAITTGVLGLVFWLFFLVLFVWIGIKTVFRKPENSLSVALFFGSCYLWLACIFYPVGLFLFVLTAFLSGAFLASYFKIESARFFCLDLSGQNRKARAVNILVLLIFVAFSLFVAVLSIQKTIAVVSFQKGIIDFSSGQLINAGKNLKRAASLSGNDIFYRHLSEYFISEASAMAANIDEPTEQEIKDFRIAIESARNNAELAVLFNRKNFENWIQLGGFYEFLAAFDYDNSVLHYENAILSYQSARVFDRQNPFLDLLLARLKISLGDLGDAENYVNSALSKKPNYSEAIFLLSRIKALQGNLEEAIESATDAVGLSPQEPSGYFQLGVLHYQNNNFVNAERALSVALSLEPQYANARYFLGLSLAKLGDIDGAVSHFKILSENFPGNQEVALILSNLEAGNEPFVINAENVEIIPPEDRSALPLSE